MTIDRGLKDTPSSSPIHDASPIRVIDAAAFHQVQILTSMGTEIRFRNSRRRPRTLLRWRFRPWGANVSLVSVAIPKIEGLEPILVFWLKGVLLP
ncbi:hypothetical protein LIER_35490 [Lithospermum erythrorhizon]|uniref:Uncharacterized protein n=1 Tax=Lithospermum erythrorhizon TaxID=34254 RepID=A0AAV3NRK4_LITER